MSSHTIHHLIAVYGLAAEFTAVALQAFWIPVPGSTVLVAAAVYASSNHGLPIVLVILVGAAAAVVGGFAGYLLGRWRGEWALLRLGRLLRQHPDRVHRLRGQIDRHAIIALIASRFISVTRNIAGILAGASGMTARRFLAITTLAALLWATFSGLEFYFFGGIFLGLPSWLQITLIVVGVVASLVTLYIFRNGNPFGDPHDPSPHLR